MKTATPQTCPKKQDHFIDPQSLRSDSYEAFIVARQQALLDLIETAMKKKASSNLEDDEAWGEQVA